MQAVASERNKYGLKLTYAFHTVTEVACRAGGKAGGDAQVSLKKEKRREAQVAACQAALAHTAVGDSTFCNMSFSFSLPDHSPQSDQPHGSTQRSPKDIEQLASQY